MQNTGKHIIDCADFALSSTCMRMYVRTSEATIVLLTHLAFSTSVLLFFSVLSCSPLNLPPSCPFPSSTCPPTGHCLCWCMKSGLHKEDILSVAYGPPSFLATSSFDGEVSTAPLCVVYIHQRCVVHTLHSLKGSLLLWFIHIRTYVQSMCIV